MERTFVGLDVHARSVVACALDDRTGELSKARLVPDNERVLAWLQALPGPVAVVYEAGPTGYGLARFLTGRGIRCVVAAPSKMHRPSGDRVKTDARDALLLARLLRLGEITAVTVPSLAQEAARDLVRVREDVRADLMRARHRTSKLLLRQGILWSAGTAWTGAHEQWLGHQRFELPGLQAAYDTTLETVLLATSRRARLDKAIIEMAHEPQWWPTVSRLQCLRGGLDADRVRARRRGRGLEPVQRLHDRGLPRARADRELQRRQPTPGLDHQDRQHPRPPAAGRGRLAPPTALPADQDHARAVGPGPGRRPSPRACRQPAPAPAVAALQRAQEAHRHRERRCRP